MSYPSRGRRNVEPACSNLFKLSSAETHNPFTLTRVSPLSKKKAELAERSFSFILRQLGHLTS